VTGILSDTSRIAALLHRHGALSVWDYAAAAPYVPIRMTASAPGRADRTDAVCFSPHKFVGGPQTPAVLVIRRQLVGNRVPTAPGGGTVSFVSPIGHRYLDDPVAREEGGTPGTVESGRAGRRAEAGGRHRPHPSPRGALLASGAGVLAAQPADRDSRQPAGPPPAHRLVPGPARTTVPAPQLRGGDTQRPVRHPGPRRLLLCRPLRATGCWPSTPNGPTRWVSRPAAGARASSPVGCGSAPTHAAPDRGPRRNRPSAVALGVLPAVLTESLSRVEGLLGAPLGSMRGGRRRPREQWVWQLTLAIGVIRAYSLLLDRIGGSSLGALGWRPRP
jgi:hypothetical protein